MQYAAARPIASPLEICVRRPHRARRTTFMGPASANLHRSGRTASGTLRPKNQSARVRSDRVLALSPDQHADCEQIENVGADADGERGPVISELVVKEAGDSPHGGHCT